MRPLSIIIGLVLAFHVTAEQNTGDYSSSAVQDKPLYYTTLATIFKRTDSDPDDVPNFFDHPVWDFLSNTDRTTLTDDETPDTEIMTTTARIPDQQTPTTAQQTTPTTTTTAQETTTTAEQPSTPTPSDTTSSCTARYHGLWVSFSILLGVPFNGAECNDIFHSLEWHYNTLTLISNWQCVEENGNFRLWFNMPPSDFSGEFITDMLKKRYPSIRDEFKCPNK
jgi:hypothetical protein